MLRFSPAACFGLWLAMLGPEAALAQTTALVAAVLDRLHERDDLVDVFRYLNAYSATRSASRRRTPALRRGVSSSPRARQFDCRPQKGVDQRPSGSCEEVLCYGLNLAVLSGSAGARPTPRGGVPLDVRRVLLHRYELGGRSESAIIGASRSAICLAPITPAPALSVPLLLMRSASLHRGVA